MRLLIITDYLRLLPMTRFPEPPLDLHTIFPDVSEDVLRTMEDTLRSYWIAAWNICERLEREHPELIDEMVKAGTMRSKVDSPKTNSTTKA